MCRECRKPKNKECFSINRYTGSLQVNCDICAESKLQYARKYRKTEKGKHVRSMWAETDSGKKAIQKSNNKSTQSRLIRIREDPALQKRESIRQNAAALLSGRSKTSRKFLADTGIENEDAFRNHVYSKAADFGWSSDSYGKSWTLEHLIPCEAFDFSNSDDIKRCWALANISAKTKSENSKKKICIEPETCKSVGTCCYPLSWNGQIPNVDEIEEFEKICVREQGRWV